MGFLVRRFAVLCVSATLLVLAFRQLTLRDEFPPPTYIASLQVNRPVKWKNVPVRYPVTSMISLPTGVPTPIPKIQHEFGAETEHNKAQREQRLAAVKETFLHSWEGYKKHAWLQDEITPVSGGYKNGYGGRGATLVDTLDTLAIMGLEKEFNLAVKAVHKIDFTTSADATLNVFETTIRYLGGLLSAHDLSKTKHHILLDKAVELGDMLYGAFDTPNRLPITHWDWSSGAMNGAQEALSSTMSAEIGSLSLEFTRLSQLTGNPKYFDAVQRVTDQFEKHQNDTRIPGLFPVFLNALDEDFGSDKTFTFGGMSDSLYEYFPKQHMLLGGLVDQYQNLYERAIEAAKVHLFFRPLHPENQDVLVSGTTNIWGLQPEGQHLACFAGGMVAIGAKIFNRTDELDVARKLVDGCIWAYDSMPTGIMPETFNLIPCSDPEDCIWSTERWHKAVLTVSGNGETDDATDIIKEDHLPPGYTKIRDRRFLLRPEAIESIFILYRITGDRTLQDSAWRMFTAIQNATATEFANSAIADVTCPDSQATEKLDSCESFWMAETLKYFYLIFADPELVSLDEFVFNTEAHPLRRPHVK
ncbi:glycoside hydrolase family 47 protein [Melanomma pulvis-pyrius CBS 109.77]|uniref:alpha-1,2-Mannosidase n=1 Tax=Melanomma pulvis-pyrius CBS 109.77 TaxID=1314802 RepID=A0A6A6XF90_9PLEO|nr:glycoside hydrolase family 47 protein [Melanomma pulvis-pyrius CBS 109.77]